MRYIKRDMIRRLNTEFNLEISEDIKVEHFNPSWLQRSEGAWLWTICSKYKHIGSSWQMSEILKAKKLSIYYLDRLGTDIEIIVELK